MKKPITTCFYLILTSAVITAVFFLPSVLSRYEDQKMFAKIEQTEIEPVEFSYSYSLFDTLNLLSGSYYTVEYPSNGGSHTADEICEITADIFKRMNHYGKKNGLLFLNTGDKIIAKNAVLQLAISSNYDNTSSPDEAAKAPGSDQGGTDTGTESATAATDYSVSTDVTTAAIWRCHLYSESGYVAEFRIDDKSGKIAGIFLWKNPYSSPDSSDWPAEALKNTFQKFFQNYYGTHTEIFPLEETRVSDTSTDAITDSSGAASSKDGTAVQNANIYQSTNHIYLTDEFGNTARMIMKISPEYVSLN